MAAFNDQAELRQYPGMLYDQAKTDARIALRICGSCLIIQFPYEDPHDVVTINTAAPPIQSGAYFDVIWGTEMELTPNIEMSMKADIAHQFWHGSIS